MQIWEGLLPSGPFPENIFLSKFPSPCWGLSQENAARHVCAERENAHCIMKGRGRPTVCLLDRDPEHAELQPGRPLERHTVFRLCPVCDSPITIMLIFISQDHYPTEGNTVSLWKKNMFHSLLCQLSGRNSPCFTARDVSDFQSGLPTNLFLVPWIWPALKVKSLLFPHLAVCPYLLC